MKVRKTTITLKVLHLEDEPIHRMSILDILEACDHEGMIGGWDCTEVSVPVKDEDVAEELKALGNDGHFFDEELMRW